MHAERCLPAPPRFHLALRHRCRRRIPLVRARIPVRKESSGEVTTTRTTAAEKMRLDSIARADSLANLEKLRADSIANIEKMRQDSLAAAAKVRQDSIDAVTKAHQDSIDRV